MSEFNSDERRGQAGGKARAEKLTKEQRSEIAKRAAESRWAAAKGIPKATHEAALEIGEASIPCAVLEDGTRILSQSGFLRALGRNPQPKSGLDETVRIIGADNLKPFITNDLLDSLKPIDYIPKNGGRALGFRAETLPGVCEAYLAAREADELHHTQANAAKAAEIIVRGLAQVGIVALVDEATGYQEERAKDALAKILEQYVADEYRKWTSTFPERFYKEIFRLKGWDWNEKAIQGRRPGVIGKYTDDIVYERLAPGVLEELRSKNPTVKPGRRAQKHFQWLTGDIGHPRLMAHLEGVTLLMRQSQTWEELKDKLDEFYPIHEVTELGIETHVKRKKIGSKKLEHDD